MRWKAQQAEDRLLDCMKKAEADARQEGKLHTVMAFTTEALADFMKCAKLEEVVPVIEGLRGRNKIYQQMGLWVLRERSYPIQRRGAPSESSGTGDLSI